ncbi:hypothetical protein [Flavobacterium sp. PL002]|uniref:hypothetical protein n=1 Tax=Flavobacterium sp. PL002 TaxID=1897058 RepID=UPI001787D27C|nr:hypothetical protein [Flavobacterium sp. PL002]MBE0392772.1 hypothetical protein [Flavobacterium sp. PL002]
MKKTIITIIKLLVIIVFFASCKSKTYLLTNNDYTTGVDFTKGKWLLNYLDYPAYKSNKLKTTTTSFFNEQLNDRYFYRETSSGLLIPQQIPLNPSKQKLRELKTGTGFDYFININSKKNKDELNGLALYEDENSEGKNQSEVTIEIYDLNLQEIIYKQKAIGTDHAKQEKLPWDQKSRKLIDNINFHSSTNKLMLGSLKKVLKDLKNKSIKN